MTADPLVFHVRAVQAPHPAVVANQQPRVGVTRGNGERVILVPVPGIPGPPGTPGGSSLYIQRHTDIALSGHRAVVPDGAGLAYADSSDLDHLHDPVWLTDAAWTSGATASVLAHGQLTEPTWNWTLDQPIFLGLSGALTQVIPPGAVFIRQLAEVVDAHTIMFQPQLPITRG